MPLAAQDTPAKQTRTVIINSANNIEYESESSDEKNSKNEELQNKIETIVLTGAVSVSVQEGTTLDTIFADRIIYNKKRHTLHAEVKVRYDR